MVLLINNASSCLWKTYFVSDAELSVSGGELLRHDPGPRGTDSGAKKADLEQRITHN